MRWITYASARVPKRLGRRNGAKYKVGAGAVNQQRVTSEVGFCDIPDALACFNPG